MLCVLPARFATGLAIVIILVPAALVCLSINFKSIISLDLQYAHKALLHGVLKKTHRIDTSDSSQGIPL